LISPLLLKADGGALRAAGEAAILGITIVVIGIFALIGTIVHFFRPSKFTVFCCFMSFICFGFVLYVLFGTWMAWIAFIISIVSAYKFVQFFSDRREE
jgi:hypothetical protein